MLQTNLTSSRYVTTDPDILQGEPIVVGTQVAVRDIILLWKAGVRPEEISEQLYGLVTTAQVFDAISCYLDDSASIEKWITWYEARPILNVPARLRRSPLWDEVITEINDNRQQTTR